MKKKKKKSTIGSDLLDKLLLCFLGKGTRDSRLGFHCKVESSLDILQENFRFSLKKVSHPGLEHHENEEVMKAFHFWVNYPFNVSVKITPDVAEIWHVFSLFIFFSLSPSLSLSGDRDKVQKGMHLQVRFAHQRLQHRRLSATGLWTLKLWLLRQTHWNW